MFCPKKALLSLLIICCTAAKAQLIISPQTTAQALAQYLVGDGITISNVTITGSGLSAGYFKHIGGTQLNLDSGIVLSTGRVQTSGGFIGLEGNANSFSSSALGSGGDNDLSGQIGGAVTNDAIILEFDFVPLGDTVQFRYAFSSEEYPTFTCSNFNDVFAFFITGPGITGIRNMALVPGTNIPVSINSINSGNPGPGYNISACNAMGPGSPFMIHYANNASNPWFSHNAHTKVLVAKSAVQPCQTYHLKIALADVADESYDSGVFLEAKSLKSDPIQLVSANPLVGGLPYLVEGCHNGAVKVLRSRKYPYAQPVTLTYAGTAINGVDVQTLPGTSSIPAGDSVLLIPITPVVDNTLEGIEILKIYVSNGCVGNANFFMDSLEIQIRDYDTLSLTPKDTTLCRNASAQLSASGTYNNYQWSPATGLNNAAIANPLAIPQNTTTYVCTATINNCTAIDSLRITVRALEVLSVTDVKCKNGTTGAIKVSGGWEWKPPVQYNINTGAYGVDSSFANLPVGSHTVRIKDVSGCIDSLTVSVTQSFADLLVIDSIVTASCVGQNGQVFLSGSGGLQQYNYALDNGLYSSTVQYNVTGGAHTISIKDSNGCITTRPITVANDPNITVALSANGDACNGSPTAMIYVTASGGSGLYQYSVDGVNFGTVDSFTVSSTPVTATVRDNKGCTATQSINVPINQLIYIRAGNDTTICEGTGFTINTQSNAASFTWSPATSLSSPTVKNPYANPVDSVTYFVTGIKDICVVRDTITVKVFKAPVAEAGLDSSICYGRVISLNGSGGVRYEWTPSNGVSDPSIASPSIRPLRNTTYYLHVINANNCRSLQQDSVKITLVPAVNAWAGKDTSIGINQPLQLNGVDLGNSGVTIYQWSPITGLNNPNIANPIAVLDKDQEYVLTLTTPEGCQGTDTIRVKAFNGPEIYVPSGFTPNGDGKNDVLRAIPIGMKEFHYFRVFNRWGQMIFSTTTERQGWNGFVGGAMQPNGTYVWIAEAVDFRGNLVQRKGTSTLIR